MKLNRRKKRAVPWVSLIAIAFFSATALISAWKIADYLLDERKSRDYWDALQSAAVVTSVRPRPEPVPGVPSEEESEEEPEGEPEIQIPEAIDFDSLQAAQGNVVAWLLLPGTTINYPVAQAEDNDYYLHRLLDGAAASGGSLFADYRCGGDFSDWNTVIYGHHMKNGTMFGSLADYRDPAYFEEHPVMYLYVPEKRYRLELIAAYTADTFDRVFSLPATKEKRDEIVDHASRKSSFISGATLEDEDRLVTLSTCSYAYDDARHIVIGRLVEDEEGA